MDKFKRVANIPKQAHHKLAVALRVTDAGHLYAQSRNSDGLGGGELLLSP